MEFSEEKSGMFMCVFLMTNRVGLLSIRYLIALSWQGFKIRQDEEKTKSSRESFCYQDLFLSYKINAA